MDTSVKSRPNHYETLGLTPGASDDEIRQAFARKLSEWRLTSASTQICIAYETLGNRFKRVDYDRSHGLEPQPPRRPSTVTVTQQRWAPFIASVPTNALGQAACDASAQSRFTSSHDPQMLAPPGARVAALPSELARPDTRGALFNQSPQSKERGRSLESVESQLLQMPSARLADGAGARDSEERLLDWKRPALAVGGFVLAAGLIGAIAGLSLKDDENAPPGEPAVASAAAPASRPQPKAAPSVKQPLATVASANEPTFRLVAPQPRTRPNLSRRHTSWRVRHRAVKRRVAGSAPADGRLNANQGVIEAPVSQPVVADVPHSTP